MSNPEAHLASIETKIAAIEVKMEERDRTIFNELHEIKNILRGNGQPGLCAIVTRHDEELKQHHRNQGLIVTITALGLTILGLLIAYFRG